jgi:hypothetical protein
MVSGSGRTNMNVEEEGASEEEAAHNRNGRG